MVKTILQDGPVQWGRIKVRRAQYMFRDKTGEVRVRIQRELWRGREITGKTVLRLKGRVQSDVRGRFVYVDSVQVLK